VHRVELASPAYTDLTATEWADAQAITLTVVPYDG
jgi:hypothetical protein